MISILFQSLTSLCSEAFIDLLQQCWKMLPVSVDGASFLYVQVISYLQEDQRSSTTSDMISLLASSDPALDV